MFRRTFPMDGESVRSNKYSICSQTFMYCVSISGLSDNGWMTTATFFEYITDLFHPFLRALDVAFPVIVFLDGHTSHLSFETQDYCQSNGIILVPLYPNSTHILQPMDVACFKSLKYEWREAVHAWKAQTLEPLLNKENFCELFSKVSTEVLQPHLFKSGFECCGLYPFNPDRINYNKLLIKKGKDDCENNTAETDRVEFLNMRERFGELLGLEKLNTFCNFYAMNKNSEWTGHPYDRNLYGIWKKIVEKCNGEPQSELPNQSEIIKDTEEMLHNDVNFSETDLNDWIEDAVLEFEDDGEVIIDNFDDNEIRILEDIQIMPPDTSQSTYEQQAGTSNEARAKSPMAVRFSFFFFLIIQAINIIYSRQIAASITNSSSIPNVESSAIGIITSSNSPKEIDVATHEVIFIAVSEYKFCSLI